ncbi:flavodoxin domain-containing protein [Amycolatopsis sp. NBC_01286]|uniref:flavodoxin domain-containing protein n=1 Tax=Amycolatopsis sp. NBC_01286 TaxID=2903560 RepID=UPI002E1621A0|nr:flavodoxin domain-containing protein [Amycolatopsis sp. NBC_01286]
MRILVTVASRHGATREIAENIATASGAALTYAGVRSQIETRDASLVTSVEGYDAVVLGSAVYMGHWLEPAVKFAETFVDELRRLPVWVFSSGPVGERDQQADEPAGAADVVMRLGARGHRLFGGKIEHHALHLSERAMVAALRVKDGDYRDWPSIRSWGREIGATLAVTEVAGSRS